MTIQHDKTINTSIEILGKFYSVRCPESEQSALRQAATYLNHEMQEVKESGKAINLERIAIITALNITYQFLQQDQQKSNLINKIEKRIKDLQDKIDTTLNDTLPPELIYSPE